MSSAFPYSLVTLIRMKRYYLHEACQKFCYWLVVFVQAWLAVLWSFFFPAWKYSDGQEKAIVKIGLTDGRLSMKSGYWRGTEGGYDEECKDESHS